MVNNVSGSYPSLYYILYSPFVLVLRYSTSFVFSHFVLYLCIMNEIFMRKIPNFMVLKPLLTLAVTPFSFCLFLFYHLSSLWSFTIMSTHTEKTSSTIKIKNTIHIVLDFNQMIYDIWHELFKIHYIGYGVAEHLSPPVTPSSTSTEKAPEKIIPIIETPRWKCNKSVVKSWIYSTLVVPLLHFIFRKQSATYEVWETIEILFYDNKNNKVVQIDNELCNITIGNSSMVDYCNWVKSLDDFLDDMDAKVLIINIFSYMLNGLSLKYCHIATIIWHQWLVPSFLDTLYMLVLED